jgi:hypothetical protein
MRLEIKFRLGEALCAGLGIQCPVCFISSEGEFLARRGILVLNRDACIFSCLHWSPSFSSLLRRFGHP